MSASTLRWPLFALIGLMVAVAVALLANQLVSERIGISSEPLTVGQSLSPKQARREPRRHNRRETPTQTSTGSTYTGTVPGDASSTNTPSDRSQSEDSKSTDHLGTSKPATPTPSTGGGSDTSTAPEPGDD
jgi:hypothetical protein